MLAVLSTPGTGLKDVRELFTFWRPMKQQSGRKSQVLALTDRQLDAMYALAGENMGGHIHR